MFYFEHHVLFIGVSELKPSRVLGTVVNVYGIFKMNSFFMTQKNPRETSAAN